PALVGREASGRWPGRVPFISTEPFAREAAGVLAETWKGGPSARFGREDALDTLQQIGRDRIRSALLRDQRAQAHPELLALEAGPAPRQVVLDLHALRRIELAVEVELDL